MLCLPEEIKMLTELQYQIGDWVGSELVEYSDELDVCFSALHGLLSLNPAVQYAEMNLLFRYECY